MADLKPIIEQSMTQYAGAVLQSRALVDVRDCLKPSARQIFYCMHKYKYTADKPFQPTAAAMGDALKHFYIHGDSSCVGIIMRAGESFAMRYPLIDVRGNAGMLYASGSWAAERYTKSRLSKLASYLFDDIDKNTIDDWRDNYADNEQYPGVLPTKGFYNLVNGTSGIGIGMACSVPQYNLKELNNALIHLIDNPDCDFEEIYCAPDFATGAILYNESDVKESMKNGTGSACKLRSVVEYDEKDRCLVVKEIPYGVYTNTICGQLENIVNGEENPGIERFNDLTGVSPLIKIYLSKKANPDKVLKYLFKNTSLQYHYSVNFTMLDNGRFPRVFGWKDMLQAHIDHERVVYRRGFEFDMKKYKARIHILDGLLICMASIDEVIQTIRDSSSSAEASKALQERFLLDADQAKAVLDMKLSRLARLEVKKLENEREELQSKVDNIERILNDEELFKEEIKRGWREVAAKFGDERRTQIMNLQTSEEDDSPIEEKTFIVNLTNKGTLYAYESTTLMSQRRGGKGVNTKLPKDEYIINSISEMNVNTLLLFTNKGKVYSILLDNIPLNTPSYPQGMFNMDDDEVVCNLCSFDKTDSSEYIIFTTKNGLVKKSRLSEYKIKKGKGVVAIKLREDDSIVNVGFTNNEPLGILTKNGLFVKIDTEKINPIGRVTSGVQGIKLNEGDEVVDAHLIPANTVELVSTSSAGLAKRTSITEYPMATRATKGSAAQKLKEGDSLSSFVPLNGTEKDLVVISSKGSIKIPISQIQQSGRSTMGTQVKKLVLQETIQNLIVEN